MQTEVDVRPRSLEYRGSDKIHSLWGVVLWMLIVCLMGYFGNKIEAVVLSFFVGLLALILISELMRNRQGVLVVDFAKSECHAKKRRLFLADQVATFGFDEVANIGLQELHCDEGTLFTPTVVTKSGCQLVIGECADLASSAHAKAKEFAEALGLDYQENILQEVVSTAAKEVKADA